MITIKRLLILTTLVLAFTTNVYATSILTLAKPGVNFGYEWLDTSKVEHSTLNLESFISIDPHQFYYNFDYIYGKGMEDIISFEAAYAYKEGKHWAGAGVGSSGTSPFSSLNAMDFNFFYSHLLISRITQYAEGYDGQMHPFYLNFYLGFEYATDRILLDSYPLPVIRFEYGLPNLDLIIGFPLTHLHARVAKNQYFEFTYVPVLNINLTYGYEFDKTSAVKLIFSVEQNQYRSYPGMRTDTYFREHSKYFTETVMIAVEYNAVLADTLTLAPYVGFIPTARSYYGQTFDDYQNSTEYGTGYMLGLKLSVKI